MSNESGLGISFPKEHPGLHPASHTSVGQQQKESCLQDLEISQATPHTLVAC